MLLSNEIVIIIKNSTGYIRLQLTTLSYQPKVFFVVILYYFPSVLILLTCFPMSQAVWNKMRKMQPGIQQQRLGDESPG